MDSNYNDKGSLSSFVKNIFMLSFIFSLVTFVICDILLLFLRSSFLFCLTVKISSLFLYCSVEPTFQISFWPFRNFLILKSYSPSFFFFFFFFFGFFPLFYPFFIVGPSPLDNKSQMYSPELINLSNDRSIWFPLPCERNASVLLILQLAHVFW